MWADAERQAAAPPAAWRMRGERRRHRGRGPVGKQNQCVSLIGLFRLKVYNSVVQQPAVVGLILGVKDHETGVVLGNKLS